MIPPPETSAPSPRPTPSPTLSSTPPPEISAPPAKPAPGPVSSATPPENPAPVPDSGSEQITKTSNSNLALAFMLLPKDRRGGMVTFYAFCAGGR